MPSPFMVAGVIEKSGLQVLNYAHFDSKNTSMVLAFFLTTYKNSLDAEILVISASKLPS